MTWIGSLTLLVGIAVAAAQQCGVPKYAPREGNSNDRIVGGTKAVANSWPWQASFIYWNGQHFCGGSLINNQWILSAAHCFERLTINDMYVRLGEHHIQIKETGEYTLAISRIIQHRSYTRSPINHDIALVKLTRPITFTAKISPVCLPPRGRSLMAGTNVHVTGWGSDGVYDSALTLKQTMVPVVDWNVCRRAHYFPVATSAICTGYPRGGHNACHGDSGGPLVVRENNVWYLHGVVSWGSEICGIKEEPAVYTKVSDYISWIENAVSWY